MSDKELTIEIRRHLPGEWWYFAGQLRAALNRKRGDPDWEWYNQPTSPTGCIIHIGPRLARRRIASVIFVGKGESTTLVVHTIPSNLPHVQPLIDDLEATAREAREARRDSIGETPDELIEEYYRRRAAGSKVTLKQLAEQAGMSYSWLRQRKMEYDRAGKWGSKQPNKTPNT